MKTPGWFGAWFVIAFSLLAAMPLQAAGSPTPKAEYKRTIERYAVPDVTLLNQDGRKVKLQALLDTEKPVIVDFIYSTCTTICPVLSANYLNLQNRLGPATDSIQLISISIDPEHDRPEQLKKYMTMFRARKGWDFLTGSRDDIYKVLKVFDALFLEKMYHAPIYLLRAPRSEEWVRVVGLVGASDLEKELKGLGDK